MAYYRFKYSIMYLVVIFRKVITFIKVLPMFLKMAWKYQWYDYSYMLEIWEYLFRHMSENHYKHGHLKRSRKTAKELLICAELCRRISEDDYFKSAYSYVKEDAGEHLGRKIFRFKPVKIKSEVPNPNSKFTQDLMYAKLRENDTEYLTKLINKHLFTWWD